MDRDQRDMIIRLATQAGMSLEDASVEALTVSSRQPEDMAPTLISVGAAIERAAKLIEAASILARGWVE